MWPVRTQIHLRLQTEYGFQWADFHETHTQYTFPKILCTNFCPNRKESIENYEHISIRDRKYCFHCTNSLEKISDRWR